jgi:hypothetical protein
VVGLRTMNRTSRIWAAVAAATSLVCAHPPVFEVGACPSEKQLAPKLSSVCSSRAFERYLNNMNGAALRSVGQKRFTGKISITYSDGPTVESVCFRDFDSILTPPEILRLARAAGSVRPSSSLQCLAGHRLEHTFLEKIDIPPELLPPGAVPLD